MMNRLKYVRFWRKVREDGWDVTVTESSNEVAFRDKPSLVVDNRGLHFTGDDGFIHHLDPESSYNIDENGKLTKLKRLADHFRLRT